MDGFALEAYLVPKCGFQPIVPGGTIPKAPNEAGSLFTEVKKNAKYPGPDHYKKEGKPFGQKAPLGMFSRINRDDKDGKKHWPAVGQYQSVSEVVTPRTRGGIMAKCLWKSSACCCSQHFILAMTSSVGTQLECHDQALLQCILDELKLKGSCSTSRFSASVPRSQFLSPGKCPMEEETRSPSAASATPSPRSLRSTSPPASCRSSPHPMPAAQPPVALTLSELLPPSACPSPSQSAPAAETSAVWRVMNPNAKFKASCGFPLVSPQLSTPLLDDFRVIFAPGSAWAMAQNKGGKKKELASNKVAPLYGSLQIKFLSDDAIIRDLQLFFTIGNMRLGPFRTSPERSTSELCELPVDWRRLVDKADTSFAVTVEMTA
ncbi:unnamed protein product [Symbiodinium pilosum]|uniref:Uncharacterized protein n=1 Tax=Symbiodinium pilosum TaxID=2952 RepID=A0A812T5C8_SYMPI|nr:unnamed protein product [Symbiodinium pilosum]